MRELGVPVNDQESQEEKASKKTQKKKQEARIKSKKTIFQDWTRKEIQFQRAHEKTRAVVKREKSSFRTDNSIQHGESDGRIRANQLQA